MESSTRLHIPRTTRDFNAEAVLDYVVSMKCLFSRYVERLALKHGENRAQRLVDYLFRDRPLYSYHYGQKEALLDDLSYLARQIRQGGYEVKPVRKY